MSELLQSLPDTLQLRPAAGSTLRATMDLIAGEMLRDDPGQQTLLDRLLDVALVQILRDHRLTAAATAPGWFRGSGDIRIGAALQALHANPGHPWTVAELAEHALLSRSAFARRFTELLEVPPLTYVNDWRMALARDDRPRQRVDDFLIRSRRPRFPRNSRIMSTSSLAGWWPGFRACAALIASFRSLPPPSLWSAPPWRSS